MVVCERKGVLDSRKTIIFEIGKVGERSQWKLGQFAAWRKKKFNFHTAFVLNNLAHPLQWKHFELEETFADDVFLRICKLLQHFVWPSMLFWTRTTRTLKTQKMIVQVFKNLSAKSKIVKNSVVKKVSILREIKRNENKLRFIKWIISWKIMLR